MSAATTILQRVATTLATVAGLSADKVIRGRPATLTEGGSPPVAWVFMESHSSSYGPDLTSYQRDLVVGIIAVPTSGGSYAEREDAGLDLADAIYAALEADTTLAGLLTVAPVLSSNLEVAAGTTGSTAVAIGMLCQYRMEQGGGL